MTTIKFKYQTDANFVYNVRDDGDSVLDAIRGAAVTAALTENITLKKTRHSKQVGLRPRMVLFARLIGATTTTTGGLTNAAKAYKKVVIPTKTAWSAVVTGAIGGAGVTNFTQKGATYYATALIDEDRN